MKSLILTLFTAVAAGPAERTLLVVHGGADWDHSYLREPLSRLAGTHRLVMPDLRGCGRSATGLADWRYTPDAVVADLLALLDHLGARQVAVLSARLALMIAAAVAPAGISR
jgi:pimeloyl-ACP methyl ester carboxylesterase